MTTVLTDVIAAVPPPVKTGFGAVGALFVASKVFNFLRLFLSVFVLPGANVSILLPRTVGWESCPDSLTPRSYR